MARTRRFVVPASAWQSPFHGPLSKQMIETDLNERFSLERCTAPSLIVGMKGKAGQALLSQLCEAVVKSSPFIGRSQHQIQELDLTCHGKSPAAHRTKSHQEVQKRPPLGLHTHVDGRQVVHQPDGRQAHVAMVALGPVLRHRVLACLDGPTCRNQEF